MVMIRFLPELVQRWDGFLFISSQLRVISLSSAIQCEPAEILDPFSCTALALSSKTMLFLSAALVISRESLCDIQPSSGEAALCHQDSKGCPRLNFAHKLHKMYDLGTVYLRFYLFNNGLRYLASLKVCKSVTRQNLKYVLLL